MFFCSVVCMRDELLLSTGRGLLQRLRWSDGLLNTEMTIEVASVPFSTDLQQSRCVHTHAHTHTLTLTHTPVSVYLSLNFRILNCKRMIVIAFVFVLHVVLAQTLSRIQVVQGRIISLLILTLTLTPVLQSFILKPLVAHNCFNVILWNRKSDQYIGRVTPFCYV